jgi:hypothetical protein
MADHEELNPDRPVTDAAADPEDLSRAEAVAKRAMELAARAEELARQAHEVAGVDEQLGALEAELDALAEEESTLDAGIDDGGGDDGGGGAGPDEEDQWGRWAETLSERMETLGYRLGELVSGGIEAAMATSHHAGGAGWSRSSSRDDEMGGPTTKDLAVAGPRPVLVKSRGGSVDVQSGAADRVRVTWRGRGLGGRPAEPVTAEEQDGQIRIDSGRARGWRYRGVHMSIEVPVGSPVDVSTGGGSVRVKGTRGPVRTRTGGGSISVSDVDGEVSATTGGGSISVRGRLRGQSAVRTGGGSVTAVLEPGTAIELDAAGTSASIDVPGLKVKGTHVHGTVGGGGEGSLEIRTGGGGARIRYA